MSDKNNYYGLGNLGNVMETVMQNEVDILIEAEQEPVKPSLFKRLVNAVRDSHNSSVDDTTPQPQEKPIASPQPAQ